MSKKPDERVTCYLLMVELRFIIGNIVHVFVLSGSGLDLGLVFVLGIGSVTVHTPSRITSGKIINSRFKKKKYYDTV